MLLINNFIELFIESAPWLMLGLVVAGLMKALVPETLLARHLGKPGFAATLKAALLGAPLPLCSCGVIPAAVGLRRSGASKAATTSFLISTPETGVDSISISYALLGPFMAVIRPIAAIVSAITAGLLVGRDREHTAAHEASDSDTPASCCAKTAPPAPMPKDSCCASAAAASHADSSAAGAVASGQLARRLVAGLRFTFIDLVRDISLWLLIGLGFAAVIKTAVPGEFLAQWGDGLPAFIVMALIGVPMYICATASTPIAAGLLFSGVSPGAVLVFMLVGPATNIATVGLVKRELGQRALAAYLGSVVGIGFAFGYLTNVLAAHWNIDIAAQTQHAHTMLNTPLSYAASLLLAGLMMYSLGKKYLIKQ
ncbi:MAG: hypothetical protein CSA54_03560 [Gammaproteobacteria bacterium]|nr:MAG: hypothetical protein CSA54_03560 [Gammaproteobacteria bacterium]